MLPKETYIYLDVFPGQKVCLKFRNLGCPNISFLFRELMIKGCLLEWVDHSTANKKVKSCFRPKKLESTVVRTSSLFAHFKRINQWSILFFFAIRDFFLIAFASAKIGLPIISFSVMFTSKIQILVMHFMLIRFLGWYLDRYGWKLLRRPAVRVRAGLRGPTWQHRGGRWGSGCCSHPR